MEDKPGSDSDESTSSDLDPKNNNRHLSRNEKARKIRQIKKAIRYLEMHKKAKKVYKRKHKEVFYPLSRNTCRDFDRDRNTLDYQVYLQSRQLRNVTREIRKAVLQQNWEGVRTLLQILCFSPWYHFLTPVVKTACLLMFSHPKSNTEIVHDFIRLSTGYILDEDVHKFIRILFAIRKTALPLGPRGHLLMSKYGKVTHDPEYAAL